MSRIGKQKFLKSTALALLLALVLGGCVKREPRAENQNKPEEPEAQKAKRCGLICKIRNAAKAKDSPRGNKQEQKTRRFGGKESRKGKGVYHTVKKGETLWRICHTYGVDMKKVSKINGIPDATEISVGQRIWIPGADKVLDITPAPYSLYKSSKNVPDHKVRPPPSAKGSLAKPVPGGVVTSNFGERDGIMHEGVDISAPKGTSVVAADDGKVVYSDNSIRGYGNMIIIKHAGNLTTVYAHNRVNLVETGELVKKGQKIAEVGSTGRASGPHLHFEVRIGEKPVDPEFYLP